MQGSYAVHALKGSTEKVLPEAEAEAVAVHRLASVSELA